MERMQGLQKWIDIHHDDCTFIPGDKGHLNTAQVEELILENQQDTI